MRRGTQAKRDGFSSDGSDAPRARLNAAGVLDATTTLDRDAARHGVGRTAATRGRCDAARSLRDAWGMTAEFTGAPGVVVFRLLREARLNQVGETTRYGV